jgi:DNA-directed RNA polymerase subunit RPC12/RpoP
MVHTVKHRLIQLEQAHAIELRRTRCAHCRDWPGVRAVEIDPKGIETWQDPDAPAACPRCGWRPVLVKVVEVGDWKGVSRPRR